MEKYCFQCVKCDGKVTHFKEWFSLNQACPKCGSKHVEMQYTTDYASLKELMAGAPESLWHYFDFLPLDDKKNIISCKEGAIPLQQWNFLEEYAQQQYGVNCKVFVCRNDLNGGTHTFKDVAGSLLASLFKECEIENYTIASTGNTATAYSKYLGLAGKKVRVFVPNCVVEDSVNEIKSFGQEVVIVDGDYTYAKKLAAEHHEKTNTLISAGNIDPIRVEAKKTMVFEFIRQLGKMPDVYVQAISGGTGPIAIDKGVREIEAHYPEATLPRMIMVQQDTCDPMVQAWEAARAKNFPEGYEKEYPIIDNPKTNISILSTGNPAMFPIVAPIVKKSGGTFVRVIEEEMVAMGTKVFQERSLTLGPASMVCIAGFYKALEEGQIKEGDTVLLNVGEGGARNKNFVEKVINYE